MGGGFRRSGFAGKPHESVLGAEKTVALGTGLARERRLLITGEPPKQAEDRKKPNPSACPGLAEHLLPRRHGLIQSFPRGDFPHNTAGYNIDLSTLPVGGVSAAWYKAGYTCKKGFARRESPTLVNPS